MVQATTENGQEGWCLKGATKVKRIYKERVRTTHEGSLYRGRVREAVELAVLKKSGDWR